jgi:hypothetical protein
MPTENETRRIKVLKITSYLLLAAGILMLLPYPLFYLLRPLFRAAHGTRTIAWPIMVAVAVSGPIVLCIPLLSISVSAMWVLRQTGSHDEKFYVFNRGWLRYLPTPILGFSLMVYSGRHPSYYYLGAFGALLIVYSCILLKIDSESAR